jgi:predicted metal-dependent hydrolase
MIQPEQLKQEVREWADEVGVKPREIHVRQMKTKWASCSTKGRLTFSHDLLKKPEDQRTIAIVHELLHLRYPSHNKMFNTMLKTFLGRKGIDTTQVNLTQ